MTIDDLERLLIEEAIPEWRYAIRGAQYIKGYDGFVILRGDKWQLHYIERGEKDLVGEYETEHEVCMDFLKEMSTSYKKLAKYLPQAKTD